MDDKVAFYLIMHHTIKSSKNGGVTPFANLEQNTGLQDKMDTICKLNSRKTDYTN
jgi:hypothetical protein